MVFELTVDIICREAREFALVESSHAEPMLYGVTDGKAVGTYLEAKFRRHLGQSYIFKDGNSAKGIDFPELGVDVKTTSITQPQSSCPFKSARQKIFGLGYSLLVFVYEKHDEPANQTARLNILHTIFIESARTADFQTTCGLMQILANKGNVEDLMGFMNDRNLPLDEIEARQIAEELLENGLKYQGYLTISNALQWRLQYTRVIREAGIVNGIIRIS